MVTQAVWILLLFFVHQSRLQPWFSRFTHRRFLLTWTRQQCTSHVCFTQLIVLLTLLQTRAHTWICLIYLTQHTKGNKSPHSLAPIYSAHAETAVFSASSVCSFFLETYWQEDFGCSWFLVLWDSADTSDLHNIILHQINKMHFKLGTYCSLLRVSQMTFNYSFNKNTCCFITARFFCAAGGFSCSCHIT